VKVAIDARWGILLGLAYVACVLATPMASWRLLGLEAFALLFILGLSGIDPALIVGRWLGILLLVAFLAVTMGFTHPESARLGVAGVAAAILAKNALIVGALLTLAGSYPTHALLGALRTLRVPATLVATLHFMHRYAGVLSAERDRMMSARRSRSFSRRRRLRPATLAGLLAALFVRSLERGERVHSAMRARGWDGTLRSLDYP
jgi:cobalt/nickel transport system permease protein